MATIETLEISPKSAMLLGCATMAAVDGVLHDNEAAILQKLDSGDDEEDWDVAMEVFDQMNNQQINLNDVIKLINRCLNEEQKAVAFVNMVDVSMIDRLYVTSEQNLLNVYANNFGLSEDFFRTAVEIIMIKNKTNIF